MSGSASERVAVATASARRLPALTYSIDETNVGKTPAPVPRGVGERWPAAAIRHVHYVDARHHLEQFARQMRCGSGAAGGHVHLAGIRLGIRDELRNRFGRH